MHRRRLHVKSHATILLDMLCLAESDGCEVVARPLHLLLRLEPAALGFLLSVDFQRPPFLKSLHLILIDVLSFPLTAATTTAR